MSGLGNVSGPARGWHDTCITAKSQRAAALRAAIPTDHNLLFACTISQTFLRETSHSMSYCHDVHGFVPQRVFLGTMTQAHLSALPHLRYAQALHVKCESSKRPVGWHVSALRQMSRHASFRMQHTRENTVQDAQTRFRWTSALVQR